MSSRKGKKERELVQGKKCNTVNGEKYVHHNVWIEPYTEYVISQIANAYDIDENHILGLIVDQFVQQDSGLHVDRVEYYLKVILPNILEGLKNKDNN